MEMFGDPVRNPKGWPTKTLARLKVKFAYGTSAKCFSVPPGLPVLRIPNVLNREIRLDDLKYAQLDSREVNALTLHRGDLLFVRTNGNP
jgi:type I restriction enzyme, S subunit